MNVYYEIENTSPKSKVNEFIKIENSFNFTDKQIRRCKLSAFNFEFIDYLKVILKNKKNICR